MQYISIIGTGQEMKKKKKIDVFFIEIKRKKKKKGIQEAWTLLFSKLTTA